VYTSITKGKNVMLTMEISNLEVHATIRALPTHKVVSHDGIPIEIFGMLWGDWNRCDKIPIENI
jgi:hypothetical protein